MGYGGTQSEMARLINDSGVLGDSMTVTAETVNDVSFDKIIEAIHVIQDEMGITGTTSAEAASTIEGSVGSMKSAWKNLVTGLGSGNGDIDSLIMYFVDSVETAGKNIIPRIETILGNIGKLVETAAPIISSKLPGIVRKILPSLLKNGAILISSLANALVKSIPGVVSDLVDAVIEAFGLTSQWEPLKTKLSPIVDSFVSIGGDIFNTVSEIISKISETLGKIDFSALLESFSGILESIKPVIEDVGDAISWLVENVFAPMVQFLTESSWPAALDLISAAFNALSSAIDYLQPIAEKLWDDFLQPLSEWAGDAIVTIMEKLADALNYIADDPDMVENLTSIATALAAIHISKEVIGELEELRKNLIKVGESALNSAKNVGKFLNTDWSKLSGATKATAVIGSFIAGWEIGSLIYNKWEDEIDGFLFPIFDFFVNLWNNIVGFFTESIPNFFSEVGEWFSELWENIKSIFSNVGAWFNGIFTGALNGVMAVWDGITGFFTTIWDGIKSVFSTVGEWFSNIFNTAVTMVQNVWAGITGFFSGIWDGIKEAFTSVGDWFGDIFDGAREKIEDVFQNVLGFFKKIWDDIKFVFEKAGDWFGDIFDGVVEAIKWPLNKVIDAINWIIEGLNKISFDIPDWVPGIGGKSFGINISKIPELAKGGIVDDPTIAMVGESGKEAIVPLENNTEWINKLADKLKDVIPTRGGFIVENINVTVTGNEDMDIGREIAEKIAEELDKLTTAQELSFGGTGWK